MVIVNVLDNVDNLLINERIFRIMVMLVEQGHDLSCAEMLGNASEHLDVLHRLFYPSPWQLLYKPIPRILRPCALISIKCNDTRPLVTMQ